MGRSSSNRTSRLRYRLWPGRRSLLELPAPGTGPADRVGVPRGPADRTLLGHSWGGTFAFYTLFREPRVFHRYVIASSGANPEDEAAYAREHDQSPDRLHVVMEQSDS